MASGVPAKDSSVGQHRRRPALSAQRLRAGNRFELLRSGLHDHQHTLFRHHNQFAIGGNESTEREKAHHPG
jgi:hypothetical protein